MSDKRFRTSPIVMAVAPKVVNGVDMSGRDAKKNDASGSPYEVQASFERVRR